jgi:site-specific DNA-methyltransferase (adenine-specific)
MFELSEGDVLEELRKLDPNSIDALVTDPPSGIAFMGKAWDDLKDYQARTGRGKLLNSFRRMQLLTPKDIGFLTFTVDWAWETIKVLKPGAHGLVWALPRTADLTQMGLRIAGFDIKDTIVHLFGQGMPKGGSVGKMIDKKLGKKRKVIGEGPFASRRPRADHNVQGVTFADDAYVRPAGHEVTAPASHEAKQWEGWASTLKPAAENWILVRKPFKGTMTNNVLKHGVGALHINACRIATSGQSGRWPANAVLSHHEECVLKGTKKVRSRGERKGGPGLTSGVVYAQDAHTKKMLQSSHAGFAAPDGKETVEDWDCHPECAVRLLDEQSGDCGQTGGCRTTTKPKQNTYSGGWTGNVNSTRPNDKGTAARFFYTAKAPKKEKLLYCAKCNVVEPASKANKHAKHKKDVTRHPTQKSIALMKWLVRLVCPQKGTVLDPFMGSGTTGVATLKEGANFKGIEKEHAHFRVAQKRLQKQQNKTP